MILKEIKKHDDECKIITTQTECRKTGKKLEKKVIGSNFRPEPEPASEKMCHF